VHGIDLVQSLEAVDDLLEESSGLILGQSALLIEVALEVAAVAVLHDNEDTPIRGKVVHEANDVLILAKFEHTHLGLHQFL
jgi:hypothetical protein